MIARILQSITIYKKIHLREYIFNNTPSQSFEYVVVEVQDNMNKTLDRGYCKILLLPS